jgi:hypothetical protein
MAGTDTTQCPIVQLACKEIDECTTAENAAELLARAEYVVHYANIRMLALKGKENGI